MSKSKYTSIGGQALIEGIMMKGPEKTSMAVRLPDGSIDISEVEEHHLRDKSSFFALPVIRGVVNLAESLITGYKTLMLSAEKSGLTDLEEQTETASDTKEATDAAQTESVSEEQTEAALPTEQTEETEPTEEKEKSMEEIRSEVTSDSKLMTFITVAASVLGVVLAVVLFMWLPSLLFGWVDKLTGGFLLAHNLKALFEGILKIAIFLAYVAAVSLMNDIKRVFMYHGAEHKTIFCYEAKKELTVENVRGFRRFHPRCGTSFIFLVLIVSILLTSVLTLILPDAIITKNIIWVPIKILMIPLVCGLGYELIKVCGKYDNLFTRIVSAPGLWVQRLTTKEPDDSMIEVAIAAVKEVIPESSEGEIV